MSIARFKPAVQNAVKQESREEIDLALLNALSGYADFLRVFFSVHSLQESSIDHIDTEFLNEYKSHSPKHAQQSLGRYLPFDRSEMIQLFKDFFVRWLKEDARLRYQNFPFFAESDSLSKAEDAVLETASVYREHYLQCSIDMLLLMGFCGSHRCMMAAISDLYLYLMLPVNRDTIADHQKAEYINSVIDAAYYIITISNPIKELQNQELAKLYWKCRLFFLTNQNHFFFKYYIHHFLIELLKKLDASNTHFIKYSDHSNGMNIDLFFQEISQVDHNNLQDKITAARNFYSMIYQQAKTKSGPENIGVEDYLPIYVRLFFQQPIENQQFLLILNNLCFIDNFLQKQRNQIETTDQAECNIEEIRAIILPMIHALRRVCVAKMLLMSPFDENFCSQFDSIFSDSRDKEGMLIDVLKDRDLISEQILSSIFDKLCTVHNQDFECFIKQEVINSLFLCLERQSRDLSIEIKFLCKLYPKQEDYRFLMVILNTMRTKREMNSVGSSLESIDSRGFQPGEADILNIIKRCFPLPSNGISVPTQRYSSIFSPASKKDSELNAPSLHP